MPTGIQACRLSYIPSPVVAVVLFWFMVRVSPTAVWGTWVFERLWE